MRFLSFVFLSAISLCMIAAPLRAQGNSQNVDLPDQAAILVPASSVEHPGDQGQRAHTNHVIALRGGNNQVQQSGLTPLQAKNAYGVIPAGVGTIAIVDAYHYPTAESDLNVFSSKLGLVPCTSSAGCFSQVYATPDGKVPAVDCVWAQEAALDIEWAHAMAPTAKIVLVEAASSSFADLLTAVDRATVLVTQGGGTGMVSMSWGGSEFSSETSYDSHFNGTTGVIYFAASGDTGGKTIWPGVSPYVVSAGGTTLKVDTNGTVLSETGWSGSGGGPSAFEQRPSYQDLIQSIVGSRRGAPDMSFDADPNTGVLVYDTTSCQGMSGWMIFGGTSVSCPALAGIVNSAGHSVSNSADELSMIYNPENVSDFRDILSGRAGSRKAQQGWDFVTGVGSSLNMLGK